MHQETVPSPFPHFAHYFDAALARYRPTTSPEASDEYESIRGSIKQQVIFFPILQLSSSTITRLAAVTAEF